MTLTRVGCLCEDLVGLRVRGLRHRRLLAHDPRLADWLADCDLIAPAESVIGLYKTELIREQGPWKTLQDVEFATLEWVDSFNHRRLFEGIGNIPPAETEEICYATLTAEEEEGHGANEPPVNPGRFSKCILAIYTYLIISFMLCVITTNHFASLSVMVLSPLPHVMSLFRHPLFFPTSAHIKALHAFNL